MTFLAKIGLTAVLGTIAPVTYLIGYVAGLFVWMGGALTNWAMDINSQILNNNVVQIGWVVSRDLANLGFVLAIILIAFATIIRYENYGMKKVLAKLIVAALLINFSLVIAGVFLDFSGILTNFFIDKATNYDSAQLGGKLAGAFRVQTILQPKKDAETIQKAVEGLNDDFNKFINFLASQIFIAIFTAIVAISLISLAAMLYIRYIALTILLVLAPLAWLFSIWPDLESYWKKWWSEFLRWTFFAPAVTFFIYLALSIAIAFKDTKGLTISDLDNVGGIGLLMEAWGTAVGQMISIAGILYGGMYAANQIGIQGAAAGLSAVSGLKTAITTGGLTTLGLGTTGLSRAYERVSGGKTASESLRDFTAKYSGTPLVGDAMQYANRAIVSGQKERMDKYQKEYDALSPEARLAAGNDPLLMNPERRSAYMSSVSKNNQLGKVFKDKKGGWLPGGEEKYESYARAAVVSGGDVAKELISKDPALAGFKKAGSGISLKTMKDNAFLDKNPEIAKDIADAFKFMKDEAIDNMAIDSLDYPRFMSQIRGHHLSRILERNSGDIEKFVNILQNQLNNIGQLTKEEARDITTLARRINKNPGWKGILSKPINIPQP